MDKIGISDVSVNDLVVVEATILRFPYMEKKDGDEQKFTRFRRRTWTQWRTEFKLQSVWKLLTPETNEHASTGPSENVHI